MLSRNRSSCPVRATLSGLDQGRPTDIPRVFREMDNLVARNYDPQLADILRSADEYKKLRAQPRKDGTVFVLQ
jgi:hypothetical protein